MMDTNFIVQLHSGEFLGAQGRKTEFAAYAIHYTRKDACEASLDHIGSQVREVKPTGHYKVEDLCASKEFMNHIAWGCIFFCIIFMLWGCQTAPKGAITPPSDPPASITMPPTNQSVTAGQVATFTVVVAGTAPITIDWTNNGSALPACSDALSCAVGPVTFADNGDVIEVAVSNTAGGANASAKLTVKNSIGAAGDPAFVGVAASFCNINQANCSNPAGNTFQATGTVQNGAAYVCFYWNGLPDQADAVLANNPVTDSAGDLYSLMGGFIYNGNNDVLGCWGAPVQAGQLTFTVNVGVPNTGGIVGTVLNYTGSSAQVEATADVTGTASSAQNLKTFSTPTINFTVSRLVLSIVADDGGVATGAGFNSRFNYGQVFIVQDQVLAASGGSATGEGYVTGYPSCAQQDNCNLASGALVSAIN